MKKLSRLTCIVACLAALCFIAGCATGSKRLAPGGAYAPTLTNADGTISALQQPDYGLFVADLSYQLAFNSFTTVCDLEKQNRTLLWQLDPNIKHTLDVARQQAIDVNARWALARSVYKSNPTPANLNSVEAVLADMQRLASTAQTIIPATAKISQP